MDDPGLGPRFLTWNTAPAKYDILSELSVVFGAFSCAFDADEGVFSGSEVSPGGTGGPGIEFRSPGVAGGPGIEFPCGAGIPGIEFPPAEPGGSRIPLWPAEVEAGMGSHGMGCNGMPF